MNETIEKRRGFLINLVYYAAILGIIYITFKYLLWIVAPFLFAFLLAVALQKPLRRIDKKTKGKYHAAFSIILVLLSVVIIVAPVAVIIAGVVDKIKDFISYLMAELNDIEAFLENTKAWLLDFLSFLPKGIYASVSDTIVDTFAKLHSTATGQGAEQVAGAAASGGFDISSISSGITSGITSVFSIVKNVPSMLLSAVIGVIAWIFFTKDYNYIVSFIKRQLPDGKKNLLVEFKQVFSKTIVTMFKAYGIIMCITFIELFLGFFVLTKLGIMKNEYYILIAVATALFDILPVAGSGGVLIPWACFSFASGNFKQGIGLLVVYALISVIRQYIEPRIVGSSLGVHPIVTLMGLYIGLKLFGFMGMIIVPLTIMTLKAFNDSGRISIWKIDKTQRN